MNELLKTSLRPDVNAEEFAREFYRVARLRLLDNVLKGALPYDESKDEERPDYTHDFNYAVNVPKALRRVDNTDFIDIINTLADILADRKFKSSDVEDIQSALNDLGGVELTSSYIAQVKMKFEYTFSVECDSENDVDNAIDDYIDNGTFDSMDYSDRDYDYTESDEEAWKHHVYNQ